jgi:hypothetical protein
MKRKKIKHKIYLFFVIVAMALLVIASASVALIRSSFGQEKIKSFAIHFAEKNNVGLKIGSLKGNFPFQFTINETEISLPNNQTIKVDHLSFRVSFFALFFNELKFRNFEAQGVYFSPISKELPIEEKITFEIRGFTLPFTISFKSIELKDIHFNDLTFNASGRLSLKKELNYFSSDLLFTRKEAKDAYLKINAYGNKKFDLVGMQLKLSAESLALLKPWINSEEKGKISFTIRSKGSWESFEGFLFQNQREKKYLVNGTCYGSIFPKTFEKFNLDKINLGFSFKLFKDLSGSIENIFLENNFIGAFGKCILEEKLALGGLDLSFETKSLALFDSLAKIPLKGTFEGEIKGAASSASITFKSKNLKIDKYPVSSFNGNIFTQKEKERLSGQISSNAISLGESISFYSDYAYNFKGGMDLKHISLSAPSFDITSELQITPNYLLIGSTQANFNNLNLAKNFFPKWDFNAIIGASLHLYAEEEKQSLDSSIFFYDYHLSNLLGEKIALEIKAKNIFQEPKFSFYTKADNVRLDKLKIESLELTTSNLEKENSYILSLIGKWRNPLEVKSKGYWSRDNDKLNLNIQSIEGVFINQNYSLSAPIDISLAKDYFSLKNFEIKMASGSINGSVQLSKEEGEIKVVANHFPIDFLSFNPLEVSVFGFASAELSLSEKGKKTSGTINMNLDSLTIASIADQRPINARGYFSALIENSQIKGKGQLQSPEKESFLEIEGHLPTSLTLTPFSIKILKDKELGAQIALKGSIEEILDFINIGSQRVEGKIDCSLSISDTFSNPQIKGECKIDHGTYENYVTGTYLENISCNLISSNQQVEIKSFSATGQKKGELSATGTLDLREKENYPFALNVHLDNINIFQTALVTAAMKGDLKISGNKKEALAQGEIIVTDATLLIPEKIPSPMPAIDISFVNKPATKPYQIIEKKAPYPINLDILLKSSKDIFIKGKGVDANIQGEVTLKGKNTDMIPEGKLVLVKGNYLFAGKYFDLSESNIIFTGKPRALPQIYIGAKTLSQGVIITAALKGPLNAPLLSFSSSPPLPLSSIISLLLFNHDLSGISALQALQIATIVSALSEGGGDLETTKKNLGIDRLAVISKSGETAEDPDQIASQVGKYLSRGLLISYKQGVEDGMSNSSAEIDIGWGFILQIETIREEEETRGTLKWSHNF